MSQAQRRWPMEVAYYLTLYRLASAILQAQKAWSWRRLRWHKTLGGSSVRLPSVRCDRDASTPDPVAEGCGGSEHRTPAEPTLVPVDVTAAGEVLGRNLRDRGDDCLQVRLVPVDVEYARTHLKVDDPQVEPFRRSSDDDQSRGRNEAKRVEEGRPPLNRNQLEKRPPLILGSIVLGTCGYVFALVMFGLVT